MQRRRAHLPRRPGGVVRRQDRADEGNAVRASLDTRRSVLGPHAAQGVDEAVRNCEFTLELIETKDGAG